MLKFIYKIETHPLLNKKAEELCLLVALYNNCLVLESDWEKVVGDIASAVSSLNRKYPKTRPFEIYGKTDAYIAVGVEGTAMNVSVCCIRTENVASVLTSEGITDISEYL